MARRPIKVVFLRHWKMIQEVKNIVYELTILPTFTTTQTRVHRCHALLLPTRGYTSNISFGPKTCDGCSSDEIQSL